MREKLDDIAAKILDVAKQLGTVETNDPKQKNCIKELKHLADNIHDYKISEITKTKEVKSEDKSKTT